jgi:hypothetical protein
MIYRYCSGVRIIVALRSSVAGSAPSWRVSLLPMHRTESSALRPPVPPLKKRPARTLTQPVSMPT